MENEKHDAWSRGGPGLRNGWPSASLLALALGAFVFGAGLSRWRQLISDLLWLSSQ